MASEIEIANRGLQKIGQNPITSFLDNTETGRMVKRSFKLIRDAELGSNFWSFAKKRVILAPLATTPAFEWEHEYQLPSDHLQTFQVFFDTSPLVFGDPSLVVNRTDPGKIFEEEDNKILTNEDTQIKLIYIARVTDTNKYHPTFVEAFAARLGAEFNEQITQSNTKRQMIEADYQRAIKKARQMNAISRRPDALEDSFWNAVRL